MNETNPGVAVIEVRIREVAQLFNSLDPSPFLERDLDEDAEAHIVGWARELPATTPIEIVIHMPANELVKAQERGLEMSMAHYFGDRAEMSDRDLRELFRNGRRYLAIGVTVLAVCLIGSQLARTWLGTSAFARVVEESLIIVGWVANWKPIEIFLYDWWPLRRRSELYRRLERANVRLKASPGETRPEASPGA